MNLRFVWPALLAWGCAKQAPPPKIPEPDVPIAYPSPMPPSRRGVEKGRVSEEAIERLEQSLTSFTRRAFQTRQTTRRGLPMPSGARGNWDGLLDAVDRYLEAGLSSRASAEMIRARATIEVELEADAQVYEQIPPELVEAVLARETLLGLRVARIQQAAAQRQEPPPPPPPPRRRSRAAPLATSLELAQAGFAWPVYPVVVNSLFGRRFHPLYRRYREHQGLDLNARQGQVVFAAGDGVVTGAAQNGGHGLMVAIDHGNGVLTRYSHLSRAQVKVGEEVARGEPIGLAGQSGDATGPHLHFEVWRSGEVKDPLSLLGLPPE